MAENNSDAIVLETSDATRFEEQLKYYLADGYILSSSSCSLVNSESYNFCSHYQAILIKYANK